MCSLAVVLLASATEWVTLMLCKLSEQHGYIHECTFGVAVAVRHQGTQPAALMHARNARLVWQRTFEGMADGLQPHGARTIMQHAAAPLLEIHI